MMNDDSNRYYDILNLLVDQQIENAWRLLKTSLFEFPEDSDLLILAGDVISSYPKDIGLPDDLACEAALNYYDHALMNNQNKAEAWAGRSSVLLRLGRLQEALLSSETGLVAVNDEGDDPSIEESIIEVLFANKVCALAWFGKDTEARQTLEDGYRARPGSEYLAKCSRKCGLI